MNSKFNEYLLTCIGRGADGRSSCANSVNAARVAELRDSEILAKLSVSMSSNHVLFLGPVQSLESPAFTECSLRNLTRGRDTGESHTSLHPLDRVLNLF